MSQDKTASDVDFIRALAALLKDSDLAEIEVKREYGAEDELNVRLSRVSAIAPPVAAIAAPIYAAAPEAAPAAPAPAAEPAAANNPADDPGCVPSPMVGTVYLRPSPGADAFVREGDSVSEGQTLLIVEAMKTMNQIAAPRAGVVKKILVGDKEPVEYGAPLVVIG